jgi:hypothetical protein
MVQKYKEHQRQTKDMRYMLETAVAQLADHLSNIAVTLQEDDHTDMRSTVRSSTAVSKSFKKKKTVKKKTKTFKSTSTVRSRYMDVPSFNLSSRYVGSPTKKNQRSTTFNSSTSWHGSYPYTFTKSNQSTSSSVGTKKKKKQKSPAKIRPMLPTQSYLSESVQSRQFEYDDRQFMQPRGLSPLEEMIEVETITKTIPSDLKVVIKKRGSIPEEPSSPAHVSIAEDLYHTRKEKNIRYHELPVTPMPTTISSTESKRQVPAAVDLIQQFDPFRTKKLLLEQQRGLRSTPTEKSNSPTELSLSTDLLHVNNMITPNTPAVGVNTYTLKIDSPSEEKSDEESYPVVTVENPVIMITSASTVIQERTDEGTKEEEFEEFGSSFEVDEEEQQPAVVVTAPTTIIVEQEEEEDVTSFNDEFEEYDEDNSVNRSQQYNQDEDERI